MEPDCSLADDTARSPLIVIAEDAGIQVRLMQMCLERANYQVVDACDGVDALACIEREKPTLVILDVDMPRMNGFQVLNQMRNDPDMSPIPVIMLTAHAKDAVLFDEWARPNDVFMTKPFSPNDLLATVQKVLTSS